MITDPEVTGRPRAERFVGVVAVDIDVAFVAVGMWAFVAPPSFFENAAAFEPDNAHFIRDIGAFQLGLGAVLLLAMWVRDAMFAALAGAAIGAVAHVMAHVVDRQAGGAPVVDIPRFELLAVLLVAAAVVRSRQVRA